MNGSTQNGQAVSVSETDFIVSKTDLEGRLIYANRAFMQLTGYPESELLGRDHRMIRHPDMPSGIFHLMWSCLKSGRECFLYIKNLTRCGNHFWAFANISVIRDGGGRQLAYFSVQRKPGNGGVEAMLPLYQEMKRIELRANAGKASAERSLEWLMQQIASQGHSYESFIHTLGY